MPGPILGIMTLSTSYKNNSEELRYFQKLAVEASTMGLEVCVFRPDRVHPSHRTIVGLFLDAKQRRWVRRKTKLPDVVYDRCRYPLQHPERFVQFKQFRKHFHQLTYLNHPLANKWALHQVFSEVPEIQSHLPHTIKYTSHRDLEHMLSRFPICYIKPINGTGGRGIMKIKQIGRTQMSVQGREKNRRIIPKKIVSKTALFSKLRSWDVMQTYLIQQGLNLYLDSGRVHDYRVLIQKNSEGNWELTGGAARIGARQSITSNLHGGGRAIPLNKMLESRFSAEDIPDIEETISKLSHRIVDTLEKRYNPICEIALDIAIDHKGKVWLLEINQKPSREIFKRIGNQKTYETSIRRPLEYALYLLRQNSKQ